MAVNETRTFQHAYHYGPQERELKLKILDTYMILPEHRDYQAWAKKKIEDERLKSKPCHPKIDQIYAQVTTLEEFVDKLILTEIEEEKLVLDHNGIEKIAKEKINHFPAMTKLLKTFKHVVTKNPHSPELTEQLRTHIQLTCKNAIGDYSPNVILYRSLSKGILDPKLCNSHTKEASDEIIRQIEKGFDDYERMEPERIKFSSILCKIVA